MSEKESKYLEGKRKRKNRNLIARYRYRSETKRSQYQKEVEDKELQNMPDRERKHTPYIKEVKRQRMNC